MLILVVNANAWSPRTGPCGVWPKADLLFRFFYDRVFNDEDNRELRDRVRREEMEATRRVGNRLDRAAKRRR